MGEGRFFKVKSVKVEKSEVEKQVREIRNRSFTELEAKRIEGTGMSSGGEKRLGTTWKDYLDAFQGTVKKNLGVTPAKDLENLTTQLTILSKEEIEKIDNNQMVSETDRKPEVVPVFQHIHEYLQTPCAFKPITAHFDPEKLRSIVSVNAGPIHSEYSKIGAKMRKGEALSVEETLLKAEMDFNHCVLFDTKDRLEEAKARYIEAFVKNAEADSNKISTLHALTFSDESGSIQYNAFGDAWPIQYNAFDDAGLKAIAESSANKTVKFFTQLKRKGLQINDYDARVLFVHDCRRFALYRSLFRYHPSETIVRGIEESWKYITIKRAYIKNVLYDPGKSPYESYYTKRWAEEKKRYEEKCNDFFDRVKFWRAKSSSDPRCNEEQPNLYREVRFYVYKCDKFLEESHRKAQLGEEVRTKLLPKEYKQDCEILEKELDRICNLGDVSPELKVLLETFREDVKNAMSELIQGKSDSFYQKTLKNLQEVIDHLRKEVPKYAPT